MSKIVIEARVLTREKEAYKYEMRKSKREPVRRIVIGVISVTS